MHGDATGECGRVHCMSVRAAGLREGDRSSCCNHHAHSQRTLRQQTVEIASENLLRTVDFRVYTHTHTRAGMARKKTLWTTRSSLTRISRGREDTPWQLGTQDKDGNERRKFVLPPRMFSYRDVKRRPIKRKNTTDAAPRRGLLWRK